MSLKKILCLFAFFAPLREKVPGRRQGYLHKRWQDSGIFLLLKQVCLKILLPMV